MYNSGYQELIENGAPDGLGVMLVTSAYAFDAAHETLADIISSPSAEVAAVASPSNGYTTGGKALQNVAFSHSDSPPLATLDADSPVWTNLTATFRYAVVYFGNDGTDTAAKLLNCTLLDNTPADRVISGVDYTLNVNASGLLTAGPPSA
jgi:hypothetical protein